jgi:predicted nucleic acid-binding protein
MASNACTDTGPVLHLHALGKLMLLKVFRTIYTSAIIEKELRRHSVALPKSIKIERINSDQAAAVAEKYDVDLGEASALWLCKALPVSLLLTDDLDARDAAQQMAITPVGTIGILLRSFRDGLIDRESTIQILKEIHANSSLFITKELIDQVMSEVRSY